MVRGLNNASARRVESPRGLPRHAGVFAAGRSCSSTARGRLGRGVGRRRNRVGRGARVRTGWLTGMLSYYAGYSRGPEHRYSRGGGIMRIASLGLLGLSIYTGVALVRK